MTYVRAAHFGNTPFRRDPGASRFFCPNLRTVLQRSLAHEPLHFQKLSRLLLQILLLHPEQPHSVKFLGESVNS